MFKTMLGFGMAMVLAACASNTANTPAAAPAADVPAAWEVGEPSARRATDPNETRPTTTPAYAASTTTTTAAPVK